MTATDQAAGARTGKPAPAACTIDGCPRPVAIKAQQLCRACYQRLRRGGDPARPVVRPCRLAWLDPAPILARLDGRDISFSSLPADTRKALQRAATEGRISDVWADRIGVRVLGLTLEEIYGWDWDGEAA